MSNMMKMGIRSAKRIQEEYQRAVINESKELKDQAELQASTVRLEREERDVCEREGLRREKNEN